MFDKIKKMYSPIESRLGFKRDSKFFEGALLIVMALISLIFDKTIGTISIMYLLPITYVLFAFDYLFIANKYKALSTSRCLCFLIGGLLLMLVPLYVIFNPIASKVMYIAMIGLLVILKNTIDFIGYPDKTIMEVVKNTAFVVIGLLMIIFSEVLRNAYIALLIIIITIGIVKLIEGIIIKKKLMNH